MFACDKRVDGAGARISGDGRGEGRGARRGSRDEHGETWGRWRAVCVRRGPAGQCDNIAETWDKLASLFHYTISSGDKIAEKTNRPPYSSVMHPHIAIFLCLGGG